MGRESQEGRPVSVEELRARNVRLWRADGTRCDSCRDERSGQKRTRGAKGEDLETSRHLGTRPDISPRHAREHEAAGERSAE